VGYLIAQLNRSRRKRLNVDIDLAGRYESGNFLEALFWAYSPQCAKHSLD